MGKGLRKLEAGYYEYRGHKVNKLCRGRGWTYAREGSHNWCDTETRASALREIDSIVDREGH